MRLTIRALVLSLIASTAAAQPGWGPWPYDTYDRRSAITTSPDGERWQPLLVRPTSRPDLDRVLFSRSGGRLGWLLIEPVYKVRRVVVVYADRPAQVVGRGLLRREGGLIPVDRRGRIVRIDIYQRYADDRAYGVYAG